MSFKWQRSSEYNALDSLQNFSDIQWVLQLLSPEVSRMFSERILEIAWEKPDNLHILRNQVYLALRSSIAWKSKIGIGSSFDQVNPLYHRLRFLSDVVANNPVLLKEFLETLEGNISSLLWESKQRINIGTLLNELTDQNFDSTREMIRRTSWEDAEIYFLSECIRESKCCEKVEEYARTMIEQNSPAVSLRLFDFKNLLSKALFRKKLNSTEEPTPWWKFFSLSGWVSNGISQLWYIREFLRNGWTIRWISGTSIWSIIAVIVAKKIENKTWAEAVAAIDEVIELLEKKLDEKIVNLWGVWKLKFLEIPKTWWLFMKVRKALNASDKNDIKAIEEIFRDIAQEYSIDESTTFDDIKMPVIVNASYQSSDHQGEKEVLFTGNAPIIATLFASANMPGSSTDNSWMFWKRSIEWVDYVDNAANEKWNPISLLRDCGVQPSDIIAIDIWYSSTNYNTVVAQFCRYWFPRALLRDSADKSWVDMGGGSSVNINVEPSNNASWSDFSWRITRELVKIGEDAFRKSISPPAQ